MKVPFLSLYKVLIGLATLGIFGGISMFIKDHKPIPSSFPITNPAIPPFENFISGAGIIEACSKNISIGTQVPGVIEKVAIKVGEHVKKGQTLFTIDSRQAVANLETSKAQLLVQEANLLQAKASLKNAQDQWNLITRLKDKRALSEQEQITLQNNLLLAQASFKSAKKNVDAAHATVNAAKISLDFYTVKAPLDLTILQVNTLPGAYADATGTASTPLILAGETKRYCVRVSIDENDAWRFQPKTPSTAFLRGNAQYKTSLSFEYVEPFIIPKATLTGDSTELVDTRVLQVVYSFDPIEMPSYIGQEVDVYIKAEEVPESTYYGGPLREPK